MRKFIYAPDNKFIKVYVDGRLNGFIFNVNKEIYIDGEKYNCQGFFK